MIRPPLGGMAFTEAADGDVRASRAVRRRVSLELGISEQWALVRQVHGAAVIQVNSPGMAGTADALWTAATDVPIAMMTADCFGVILTAAEAVGVAHAGWRGVSAGVVARLRESMTEGGHPPSSAAIGPGIGACCFEVGSDVAQSFSADTRSTTWGTTSVDLQAALQHQLRDIDTWAASACTRHEPGWFSHRKDGTEKRLAALGWI